MCYHLANISLTMPIKEAFVTSSLFLEQKWHLFMNAGHLIKHHFEGTTLAYTIGQVVTKP